MLRCIVILIWLSSQAYAKEAPRPTSAPPPAPPCAAKLKDRVAKLEKQARDYGKKVAKFKAQHDDRVPASFCSSGRKGGVKSAIALAKEGIPLAEQLESIEIAHSSCAALARGPRLQVEELFMGLNSSYIQSCSP